MRERVAEAVGVEGGQDDLRPVDAAVRPDGEVLDQGDSVVIDGFSNAVTGFAALPVGGLRGGR